jgi:hypothetical protein
VKCFLTATLTIILLLQSLETNFGQTVTLQWDPSPDPAVVGYNVYYGVASRIYTNFIAADTSATATVSNLVQGLMYYFAVTSLNSAGLESDYSGEVAYQVGSLPCSIVVSGLVQSYDGTPKSVSVTTVPANLPYVVTYAGGLDPPTDPGSYPVTVLIADPNCATTDTEVLTIAPPTALVQLDDLNQQYDGTPKSVLVTTVPPYLPVSVTYNGLADPPADAGTYEITAIVADPIYAASASGTLRISPASALIQFTGLNQIYDGTPKPVVATTVPWGLNVVLTYDGNSQAPSAVGTYTAMASINNPNYFGFAMDLLTIAGVGPTAPLRPIAPQIIEPGYVLLLSWTNTAADISLWQSSDLIAWTPFTNVAGSSSSVTILPQDGASFFRGTVDGPDGMSALPLSISVQPINRGNSAAN